MASFTRADDRRAGIIVGVLFIVATAFLFLGEAFYKSYLDADDVLQIASQNKPAIVLGLTIELICILAIPLIGAFILPVLARVSVGMAASYFFFRSFEGVVLVAAALTNKFALLSLSEAHAAGSDPAILEPAVAMIRAQNIWVDTAGPLYNIIFVFGALCLYATLLHARLVPRWIPIWGLLSAGLLGVVAATAVFVPTLPVWVGLLVAPLVVQEMVTALWVIFRGFDTSGLTGPIPETRTQ